MRTNRPTSVGGPLLPLSNEQYAIFAPNVEAVTAEVLAWVPRSSKRQYILHLKNLPFFYYAHLPMSSNRPVNSSEALASRVIICKFPAKLPFPVHSGLQRASKSRHVHSNGTAGRWAFHHLRTCQYVFAL